MQVCNGHEDTVAHMTTPAEMRAEILATLAFLDTYTRARARAPVVLEHSSDRAVKSCLCTATHVRVLKGQGYSEYSEVWRRLIRSVCIPVRRDAWVRVVAMHGCVL
jgi:hypothetical protein